MKAKRAYYIITIHNKEDLLTKVLDGIVSSTSEYYLTHIICVLDGCVDNSEKIVDEYLEKKDLPHIIMHKLWMNDVHELLSLNHALEYIKTIESDPESLIYLLQDDVILEQPGLNELVDHLYMIEPNLGYISFRCGLSTSLDANGLLCEHSFLESEYGHWKQLSLDHFEEVAHTEFAMCEIVIKSPTVIKKRILDEVGLFDANLAPFGHDDLDLCIRLNKLGYQNAVFGAKFTSKLDWGGTREPENQESEYHKRYGEIVHRNKVYLTRKHGDYYNAKTRLD